MLMLDKNSIRAHFDADTITVYQAYNQEIANAAVANQTFAPPFKLGRMTWIKPSFLWMMYRSGWATKVGQERILSIKIKQSGFRWALEHSCLSSFDPEVHSSKSLWEEQLNLSPVRIQWDPERDIYLQKLDYRAIQIGLSDIAVEHYVREWIVSIEDITPLCKHIHSLISENIQEAVNQLPMEILIPLICNKREADF
jgi:Domain of unknown function (DUF4291)